MSATALTALSGATIGIAAAGSVWAVRASYIEKASVYLVAIFVLFAILAALPLAAASSDAVYLLFVPVLLPALLAIPAAVFRFVVVYSEQNNAPGPKPRDAVLPALGVLVMLGYWVLGGDAQHIMLKDGNLPSGILASVLALLTFLLLFCWIVVSFAYLAGTVRHLRSYRRRLKDLYSNTHSRELRWIDWFIALLVLVWCAAALALIGENSPVGVAVNAETVLSLLALLLLFLFAFAPLNRNLEDEVAAVAAVGEAGVLRAEAPKYSRSAMSEDHADRLSARIKAAMDDDRLFLDPNLSLQKLSKHVGASPNHVSQVLNEEIGETFFDYVASRRIEEAQPMILEGTESVLAISLEVGFNSRSTFYKAFKRNTGMTPREFRARAQSG